MKRLFLAIGLVAFLMTSCCDGQGNKENKGNAKCEGNCKDKKEMCDHHHGPKCPEMTAEDRAEIEGIIDMMMNWDNLADSTKVAGIAMAKARVEKCMAKQAEMEAAHQGCKPECGEKHEGCKHECEKAGEGHKCEGKCGEKHEGCKHECEKAGEGHKCEGKCGGKPECEGMKMTKEECAEKWANFDNLTLDEQKAVLCCKLHHCPGFMMVMHEKMPKPEGCCDKHEGEKHECK